MILKSALYAPQHGGHFDASIMTLLLENKLFHCPAQHGFVECTQRGPRQPIMPEISMFEAVSTPRVDSTSLKWRDGLMREMSRDIGCRYEGIIRMVGEICRDLELRCEDNERPLQEEQSKSRDLRARLERSERDKAGLELQASNLQSTISTLETERDTLAYQVEETKRQLKEQGTDLDNIQQEFDHAKIEAERIAQAAIESARQQDLVYLATMTAKDEVLEEQSLRLANTENHAKALERELDWLRDLEANNAEKLGNNKTSIETLNNAVSASERRIKELQEELSLINEQNSYNTVRICNNMALIEELNNTIVALNEVSDQNGSLIFALKDQLRKAESGISELKLQHEMKVSIKDAELKRLYESYRLSNDKWQSELEVARSSAATASEQFTTKIAGLHSKLASLRKERKVRIFDFYTVFSYPELEALRHG